MTHSSKTFRRARLAFTIVELMVAVTILSILLTATSVIWTSQQKIIQIASAQEEISPYGRAIESNLRHDLQGLSRDGFMVIASSPYSFPGTISDPAGNYNFDQLLFFSNGLKTAIRSNAAVTLTSRIWYGHLMTTDWGASQISPNAALPTWKFSLGRQDLVLQPGSNGPISIIDPNIAGGLIDYVNTDLLTIKQGMFSGASPAQNMASACYRITGQRYTDAATIATNGIMAIHALMAPFCSSFTVQFAGSYNAGTPAGQMDVDATGKIIWYGADPLTGAVVVPTFPLGNSTNIGNTFIFSPDQPTTWPVALQITADLHDSNGRIHERFWKLKTNTTTVNPVDGYRYRFIIKL